jgi:hypothetical protein
LFGVNFFHNIWSVYFLWTFSGKKNVVTDISCYCFFLNQELVKYESYRDYCRLYEIHKFQFQDEILICLFTTFGTLLCPLTFADNWRNTKLWFPNATNKFVPDWQMYSVILDDGWCNSCTLCRRAEMRDSWNFGCCAATTSVAFFHNDTLSLSLYDSRCKLLHTLSN